MMVSHPQKRCIGSYQLIQCIGDGGMGAVYAARHQLLGRHAAVKVLHAEYSHEQEYVDRFFKEARAATAIAHPGIVKIYDFGYEHDGSAYIAMELLEGEGLDRRIARLGGLPVDQTLRLGAQIGNILAAAHDHGIVHRDLKPANLFIVPDPLVAGGERIKILDFGIAKFAMGEDAGAHRTSADAFLGSPAYMAPEQIRRSADVDHRADLYAVGCILFEMLCARPPFAESETLAVIACHLHDAPPTPSRTRPDVPPGLDALIARLLAKNPAQRLASAHDLEDALTALSKGALPWPDAMPGHMPGHMQAIAVDDEATVVTAPRAMFGNAPDDLLATIPGVPAAMHGPTAAEPSASAPGTTVPTSARAAQPPVRSRRAIIIATATALLLAGGTSALLVQETGDPGPAQAAQPAAEPAPEPVPAVRKPTLTFRPLSPSERGPEQHGLAAAGPRRGKGHGAATPAGVTIVQPDQARLASFLAGLDLPSWKRRASSMVRDLIELTPLLEPHVTWTLVTEPPGAEVVDIAGRVLARTPTVVELKLLPGYTELLTLRLQGHDDKELELSGERDFDELITLDEIRAMITVQLDSEPQGATVRRDGEVVGVTPLQDSFAERAGRVRYTLELDGYQRKRVRVPGDRDGQASVTLKRACTKLSYLHVRC